MDYQKAKDIREKSFSDMMVKNLGQGDGIGESFSKTISEKTQARVKGFKQAFDPMQIAKTLTFGSNLAPALLGKLTDRSSKDIKFFSGKRRKSRANFSGLDNSVSGISKDTDGSNKIVEVLGLIYRELDRAEEDRRTEESENKTNQKIQESKDEEYEDDRNAELVRALTSRIKPKKKTKIGQARDEKGRFTKATPATPKVDTTPKVTTPKVDTTPKVETPNVFKPNPARTATPTKTTPIIPSGPFAPGFSALGAAAAAVSSAAAISIKGETGASSKKDMIAKNSQIVANDPKPGVYSYGIFGMNSDAGTVGQFIKQNPQFGFQEKPGTAQFNEEWKRIANAYPEELFNAQIKWHKTNIVDPLKKDLNSKLPSSVNLDERLIAYMSDRRIQYGKVLENEAFKYASNAQDTTEFINKITEFDLQNIGRAFKTYLQNNPNNEKGLKKRIENRKTSSLQVPTNFTGNQIDTSSKENKDLRDGLNKDKPSQIEVNNNQSSSTQNNQQKSEEFVDDRPAIIRKGRR